MSRIRVANTASQPIVNLVPNPSCEIGTYGFANNTASGSNVAWTPSRADGVGRFGSSCYRLTVTTAGVANNNGPYVGTSNTGPRIPLRNPARQHTVSVWYRTSAAGKIVRLGVEQYDSAGSTRMGTTFTPTQNITPNTWTQFTATFTPAAGTGCVTLTLYTAQSGASTDWAVGDVIDVDGVMVTEGTTLYEFADGDTPGWKWTGTPGQSASVGYPYTIERMAGGSPLVVSTTLNAVYDTGLDNFAGRTMYVVSDLLVASPGNYVTVGVLGASSQSGIGISVNPSGHMRARFDTPGGVTNLTLTSNVSGIGRHTAVASADEGITVGRLLVDNDVEFTTPLTAGSGVDPQFEIYTNYPTEITPVVAYAFKGSHNLETRKRVTAWLGRKYGAPIPAGY